MAKPTIQEKINYLKSQMFTTGNYRKMIEERLIPILTGKSSKDGE